MNLVSLERVALRLAEQQVLDQISVGIDDGDRVGLIGVNGSGKSTLLRVIAGIAQPDDGRVVHAGGLRRHLLPQEPDLNLDVPPLEAAVGADPDGELAARARGLLAHLGLGAVAGPLRDLSGGQRKRVALVRALAGDPDLLILDEPTNHLDVDVIEWLEERLLARTGALVLVTHDRYLLDRLATRVLEIEHGRLHAHLGSYASYLEARTLREGQAAAAAQRHRNRARTELAWLRRNPAARTGKARYRVERAQALIDQRPDAPKAELAIDLPARRLGTKVVELHHAGAAFGSHEVLRGVDHKLTRDARVGVVGPNGSGKTTLLSLIAGRLAPTSGKVVLGDTVAVGWYGQEPRALPPHQRVADAVKAVTVETALADGSTVSAAQLMERFLFDRAAQQAWVGDLSGGERRRLELLLVLAEAPNLLLLDEPTNDLDLDTLAVLEDFLDAWPGALVVASHDRYFLDRTCRHLFSIERDHEVRHHPGGWSQWRALRAEMVRPARPLVDRSPAVARAAWRPPPARKLAFHERRELGQLDRRLTLLRARIDGLQAELQGAGGDYETAKRLGAELAATMAELDQAETRWLELSLIDEET